MSGITPLIDTLLHQVLGKRTDVPAPKPLNQPVKPTSPAEAPRAVHSDSRLDARAPAPSGGDVAAREASRGARALPVPGSALPPSALTHFSASARTIGDLLVRFPAPPSAVSPAAPLVAPGQSASPAQVAQRLEGSIRDSGLFYESHLARWYQGKLPRQQLMREPQMLRTLQFTPSSPASPSAGAAPAVANQASGLAARVQILTPPVPFLPPGGQVRGEGAPPMPPAVVSRPTLPPGMPAAPSQSAAPEGQAPRGAPVEGARAAAPELPPEAPRTEGRREAVHESLQSLVRHQLEMLAAPSLRWEGDVWSGLFMALVIQLPAGRRDGQAGDDDAAERDSDEHGGWRSEVELNVAGLGPIRVSLWMKEVRLDIDLQVRDARVLARLENGLEALRRRLEGHGFDEVRLRVGRAAGEGEA